jgi:hypothetical protein
MKHSTSTQALPQNYPTPTLDLTAQKFGRPIVIDTQKIDRRRRHGHARRGSTSPEYRFWCNMISRTTNPKIPRFADYGGRGITVCDRWKSFESFLADMGPRPPGMTIERVDNDRGYFPKNCKWATPKEQRANQRSYRRRAA